MNIKKLRMVLCLDQKEFARLIDVAPATISQWENNKNKIRPMHLKKIKELCDKKDLDYYSFIE